MGERVMQIILRGKSELPQMFAKSIAESQAFYRKMEAEASASRKRLADATAERMGAGHPGLNAKGGGLWAGLTGGQGAVGLLSKAVISIEAMKAGMAGVSAITRAWRGDLVGADEALRRAGAVGELYGSTSDFLSELAEKRTGIQNFYRRFAEGMGWQKPLDDVKPPSHWNQAEQQQREALRERAEATARAQLDAMRTERRLAALIDERERKTEEAWQRHMNRSRSFDAMEETGANPFALNELRKESQAKYDRESEQAKEEELKLERSHNQKLNALRSEGTTELMRQRGQNLQAELAAIRQEYVEKAATATREERALLGQLAMIRAAGAMRQHLAEKPKEIQFTPYNPTVSGVLAGQQFSGVAAMANSSASIQNQRDAAEIRRLNVESNRLVGENNAKLDRVLNFLGGLGFAIGTP